MSLSTIQGNTHFNGRLTADEMILPGGVVGNDEVAAGDPIDADKLQQQHQKVYAQGSTTTAAAGRQVIHVARGAGEVLTVRASAVTKMTAGGSDDFAVTVDLYKNGTTMLTAPITMNKANLTANFLLIDGTLSGGTYVADNVLEIVVAVSGSVGTQAVGVFAEVSMREDAD